MFRPLTAEEISRRREALKQRLADKNEHNVSVIAAVGDDLSNGNLDKLLCSVVQK